MKTNGALPPRDGAVDWAKALAICAVVLIHCSANHFARFTPGDPPWLITAFWGCVTRWAVPVFLMCSGALMNGPERDLGLPKLFRRYLPRLALSLAVWAALYECLRIWLGRGSAPLGQLLVQAGKNWLSGNTYYHLYYFYFAFALYLALPLTRLIARHASPAELRYLLALWLLAGSALPFLEAYFPFYHMGNSLLRYVLAPAFTAPGLGLLGWALKQKPPKSWHMPLLLFLSGFAVVFLATWRRSVAAGGLDAFYLSGFHPFLLLMAAGLFQLCQCRQAGQAPRPVQWLSQGSFCVYLIHPFFQWLTRQAFFESQTPVWSIPVQALLLVVLSLGAWTVLRRVPGVNRWLI